ncbi:MAG: hypothetical protein CVU73_12765 [Deltaproteobacteria bacterium HGW-Deltaproteobacteria-8]|jgi:cellobiose-specific phosphotransferase system component IIA|nr:MAG: hypothetical protein CVU73_12765 [Deltaproteobacteria bacterium HGW-Deltaproteobacteria-8]
MDWWEILVRLSSAILLIVQGLIMWGLWSLRKQFVSRTHCDAQCQTQTKKQTELEQAQTKLEQAQKALPNADEVQAMAVQLAAIEGSIKTVEATVRGQSEVMQRIERPLNLLLEHHLRSEK